jgi:hypothetical protein
MKNIFSNIVSSLVVAAIVANVTMLFLFERRLTKIETVLGIEKLGVKTIKKNESVTIPQSVAFNH